MDAEEFRRQGKAMIDYVAKYLDTIETRRVTPSVEPGYLKQLIPSEAPEQPESWDDIVADIEPKIMVGMTHWQHPRFHAYFPSGASYPSILADIVGDTIGCIGFSWASGPACTELEGIMLDWLAKAMNLPPEFMQSTEGGKGGGCIQTSASECVLVSILAARALAIQKLKREEPDSDEGVVLSKLIAYCSKEAHSCVEKGAMIAFVKLRILETDDNFCLRGDTVRKAMEQDRKNGLFPFFVSTTVGTTSCCSADNLREIGPVCQDYDCWLHVDAAYAGGSQICPEFRHLFEGIEYAMSVNTNANKWLLTNFDCSCFWVRDRYKLTQALVVDPLYLQHSHSEDSIDYRHWGIPLSRRFRALKLWFVIRMYGIEGLQRYIREHVKLAKFFAQLVGQDQRFEIMNKVELGLVCFRMKGSNTLNQKLLSTINASGKLHMVPASLNDKYVIRFCVCRETACESDMKYAWEIIRTVASEVELTEPPPDTRSAVVDNRRYGGPGGLDPDLFVEEPLMKARNKDHNVDGDAVAALKQNQAELLKQKRSLFVRMVSDPKIYNPKIVKARVPAVKARPSFPPMNHSEDDDESQPSPPQSSSQLGNQPSPMSTWISWPLAFMFQDIVEEVTSEVPFRFRNWDSTLSIKPGTSSSGSTKTSPESDPLRPVTPNSTRRRSKSPLPPGVKSPTKTQILSVSGNPKKTSSTKPNHLSPPKQPQ